jgi:chorismate mutase
MELVKKIGGLKKDNQITILQVDRWKEIVSHYTSEAKILDLNEDFLKKFLNILHQESMRQQHDIMNK